LRKPGSEVESLHKTSLIDEGIARALEKMGIDVEAPASPEEISEVGLG